MAVREAALEVRLERNGAACISGVVPPTPLRFPIFFSSLASLLKACLSPSRSAFKTGSAFGSGAGAGASPESSSGHSAPSYAANGLTEGDSQRARVFVADVENKAERRLTEQSWLAIGRITWLGDGSGLVISAREQMDAPRQLWLVSYPKGLARKITNDLLDYDSVSLSADGKSLAAAQTQETFSISVAPHKGSNEVSPDLSGASEIFSEVGSVRDRISWTPDDRVVYCSRASGDWDIWIMNKDGSGQRQLTIDPHNDLFPAVSADGRFIFFASDRAGAFNIWRMEIDGSNPTQITRGVKDILPEASPDGRWVIYQQGPGFEMDDIDIWRAPAGGGAPERLTDKHAQRPAVSPDGGLLAYVYMDEKEWGLAVLALDRREVICDTGRRVMWCY